MRPMGDVGPDGSGVFSVSTLTALISSLLDDHRIKNIWVEGEITNYTHHRSGHRYFSLSEDPGTTRPSVIRCAMWKSYARELTFSPENGMRVRVYGSVDLYEPSGEYKFITMEMEEAGRGELYRRVNQWKRMLEEEGIFSLAKKKALPRYPQIVGVVTAETGAARRDIEHVIARRFPVTLLLSPCRVQGSGSEHEIADAIRAIDGKADVIIVGRGGGSFEDLFSFNHPEVVRAVGACRTPVVSAVGHEVDTTLIDYAADMRAPTPSAAAEIVVPDREELKQEIVTLSMRMSDSTWRSIVRFQSEIEDLRLRLRPERLLANVSREQEYMNEMCERILLLANRECEKKRMILTTDKTQLAALDPYAPVRRGYVLVEKDGVLVKSVCSLRPGDEVSLSFRDGSARADIHEVTYDTDI
ncbi:exodeoxyribonuclease VII large subunit [Methanogenium organophilum]|uniref:Exodeoxyribonuclease VII large subunit n=1 Tax=Methanogenium organophilum TaxID=2199 RepID=A0A9X9S4F9_METOG|nr:exodeoxyribonuclease VII large subunit [Methanogenium organophilum]WAI00725.1 exodeoxyribonuclease VII large subunit [Methanogenium organophilum]